MRQLSACTSRRSAYAAGLAYIAETFNAPYAALTLDVDNHSAVERVTTSDDAAKSWSRHCDGMMLNVRYREHSQARFFQATQLPQTFAILTVPLTTVRDGTIGAMAVVIVCQHRDVAVARLSELQSLAAIIDLQANSVQQRTRPGSDAYALSKVASHRSLDEFCFTLTNSLKSNLNCTQVALGLVRRHSIDVVCVSGFDALYPRSPGTRLIQQAMCECLDADGIVCHQPAGETEEIATAHHLHKHWHASMGASPVASVPLHVGETCVAVVSLCNPAGSPFRPSQLSKVQELVAPMMPGLLLLKRAERSTVQRLGESLRQIGLGFRQPGKWHRKVAAAMLVVMALWVLCGTTTYRLTAPCSIEPIDDLQLSAAFEEAIADVYVRAGDRVSAGQPLLQLETKHLRSQYDKFTSQRDAARTEMMQAIQSGDVAKAAEARSNQRTAEAELTLLEQKLSTATLVAPSDGIILEGSLDTRIGEIVALGEPLIRFAPQGEWKVVIHVPDHAFADLAEGQLVNAAVSARPQHSFPLYITQLHAASRIEEGKNVFAAEATSTAELPSWLRAGMRGVARVDMGERPVWWVWSHRTVDAVRMHLWKL
jgi:hypothetical protein